MRKRVISTLLAMATTAGLFAGNVSAVYAEGKSSGDYEYQELEDAEITYYNYSVEGKLILNLLAAVQTGVLH